MAKRNAAQSGRVSLLVGGGEGIRTPDLYSAIVALSQLSYAPDIARLNRSLSIGAAAIIS